MNHSKKMEEVAFPGPGKNQPAGQTQRWSSAAGVQVISEAAAAKTETDYSNGDWGWGGGGEGGKQTGGNRSSRSFWSQLGT